MSELESQPKNLLNYVKVESTIFVSVMFDTVLSYGMLPDKRRRRGYLKTTV